MPTDKLLDEILVLVVEDDADSRDMLKTLLECEGARVIAVDCGPTALQVLGKHSPDVLVSDISMPGMDGIELMQEIRSRERTVNFMRKTGVQLPAAAMSALNSSEDRGRSFDAGFRFFIPKPVDIPLLLSMIAQLAASSPAPTAAFRLPN